MALQGKMIIEIEVKCDTDIIHELFCHKPYSISKLSPDKIHACDLHEGKWGEAGSLIFWEYTHEGKKKTSKHLVEPDPANKSIKLTTLEGDLLELYKTFIVRIQVKKLEGHQLVRWTAEYEKHNEDIEDPDSIIQYWYDLTRDIEAHHLP